MKLQSQERGQPAQRTVWTPAYLEHRVPTGRQGHNKISQVRGDQMEKSSETQDEKSELCFTSTDGKGNCFLPSAVFQWLTYLLFSIVKLCDNVDWLLLFHSGQPHRFPVLRITLQTLGYTHDFYEDEASICFFSLCQLFFKKSSTALHHLSPLTFTVYPGTQPIEGFKYDSRSP